MRKTFVVIFMLTLASYAFAYDFEVDGIYYKYVGKGKDSVEVTDDGWRPYKGDVVIPSSVVYKKKRLVVCEIEYFAFYNCDDLTSVTIPNSVTTIGSHAFSGCDGLTNIKIPSSVTTIGGHLFSGCKNLERIVVDSNNKNYDSRDNCNAIIETSSNILMSGCKNTKIPNSVTTIGEMAFYDCDGLISVEIPNGVTTIGKEAFAWCESLKSITIPNSVTKIGDEIETFVRSFTSYEDNPFIGCKNLEKIVVDINNKKYDSRDDCNAIIETNRNILVAGCKNTKIPDSVTAIGENAFVGCSNLKNIIIPNSVIEIGYRAFEGCVSLANVSISNSVSSIKWGIFRGCKSLTSVTIPNSVTTIGLEAFSNCVGLTSVTIPNSVTKIDGSAFGNCDGLTSVTIPNSVTKIDEYAFGNCYGLTSVILSNGSVDIHKNAFYGCKSLKHISVPKDFDLKKLNLPKGIKVTHTPIIFSEIAIDSIKYEGKTKDGEIRCNEKGNLYLLVRNSSYGKAKDAIAKITVGGATKGIEIPKEQKIGDLPQKQSTWVKIPIETTEQTIDGKINVKIVVSDDYGVKSNEKEIEIKTHKLPVPDLKIMRYELLTDFDTVLTKEKVFELKLTLKNEGEEIAKNHELMAFVPEGLKVVNDSKVSVSNVSPNCEIDYVFMLYSSAKMKDNVVIRFEIHNPEVKTKAENYNVDLQFYKTKTTQKNIIQNSIPERVGIDSIAIVGRVALQQYTSLELMSNKWARYKSNHIVLQIKISGDKPEIIRRAKELLNVNLGTQLVANGVHKDEPNEVWFLIPIEARRILLTCGDGCREIEIWNGELKNNSVYQGEIRVY